MTKYRSPFTVDYRKPIIIASNDPRNKNGASLNKYKSRAGSKVITTTIGKPLVLDLLSANFVLAVATNDRVGDYFLVSEDGTAWTKQYPSAAVDPYFISNAGYTHGEFLNNKFTFIGKYVATSLDGYNWKMTLPNIIQSNRYNEWQNIVYGNEKYIINTLFNSGPDNSWQYSLDLITWTNIEILYQYTNIPWPILVYGNNKFLAISHVGPYDYATAKPIFATSTNAITWTFTESQLPTSVSFWNSIYYNNKFIIISSAERINSTTYQYYSDKVFVSEDAISWTEYSMPILASWSDMAYGSNKIVAVSHTTSSNNDSTYAAYSSDGINWSISYLPYADSWTNIVYSNNKFIASSYRRVAQSVDGITWTLIALTAVQSEYQGLAGRP